MKVFGFIGHSGSGKTTLIEALLPLFQQRGMRINVLKHSHHDLELEPPDKDSARFRQAGAAEVLVASPYRYAVIHELRGAAEPTLQEQLERLQPADLTLVEGFKPFPIPRIEVYRPSLGKALRYPEFPSVLAVASDETFECPLPLWPLNDPADIAERILRHFESTGVLP
ncbi:molybdopterin-guanine dinucleotide biosynthesis protein B [Parachitinimonas caeni]|uniref:Molybdopterin-guanine dinucleotide biosynthesis protein B n=1 Tax=Parachitinimonas caeni TaxID=3031301 RepID=A0ABT7E047_9NEIS|nr:molybdopterin-guanine dinucleotide biosynthesis protein B [Parachitinimonas caeni]MDK2125688.1 molybdopterin-guanine dinucleotide biosynthesis protein B [Parachitinimonas caeni]